jgi:MFS family permease
MPGDRRDQADAYDRTGLACVNLGSLLSQLVQIAGYPTLLSLGLTRADYAPWVVGIIVSLQWIVVLLMAPFVPSLMSKLGPRLTCQAGAATSIASAGLLLASSAPSAIAVSSLLMGLGLTIRWVACDTWIVQSTPDHLRGRAVGIHETLMGLGIAIGPLLTMLSAGNETTALLIFMAILACAIVSFAFGSSSASRLPDSDEDQTARAKIAIVLRTLVPALVAAMVAGYIETTMVALLPVHLMTFRYSEANALALLSAFGLGGTILQTPLGWVADRWSFRTGQILCAGLIVSAGLVMIFSVDTPGSVLIALFVLGGCVGGLNTLAVIEAGASLRAGLSGTGMALIASCYTLGGVVGPVVSGSTLAALEGHGAIVVIVVLTAAYASLLARRSPGRA